MFTALLYLSGDVYKGSSSASPYLDVRSCEDNRNCFPIIFTKTEFRYAMFHPVSCIARSTGGSDPARSSGRLESRRWSSASQPAEEVFCEVYIASYLHVQRQLKLYSHTTFDIYAATRYKAYSVAEKTSRSRSSHQVVVAVRRLLVTMLR